MKLKTAPLPALIQTLAAIDEAIATAREGSASFVLLYGGSGSGKTFAARVALQKHRQHAFFLRASQIDTSRSFLMNWVDAVNGWLPSHRTAHGAYIRIIEELHQRPPSFTVIDEADYLALGPHHALLNVARDVADAAGHCLVFISVQTLARRLFAPTAFTQQVTSRIVSHIHFTPPTLADAMLVAAELLEVIFERDLVAWCHARAGGSIRQLVRLYGGVEAGALAAKLRRLSLGQARELELIPSPAKADALAVETVTVSPVTREKMAIAAGRNA